MPMMESRHIGRRIIAATAVFLALTGCESKPVAKGQPGFNHPPAGAYFHDSSDKYYADLQRARQSTDNPVALKNIDKLMRTPIAQWLNADNANALVSENLARRNGTIPLFVLYNIPIRDLGGEAGGGETSAEDYQQWIQRVSDTIDDAPAVVVLEPDALAGVPSMKSESDRTQRIAMLHDALTTLRDNNPNTAVYLDAGNSRWLQPTVVANLIRQVDPAGDLVGGISLNVSYQASEEASRSYATAISSQLGRPLRVIIDNSMNGAPNTDMIVEWCNPAEERIGTLPDTTYSAGQVEQAYIKVPGESDGVCGTSDKKSGGFDDQLLIRQVS